MSKRWLNAIDVQEDSGKLIVEVAPLRRRHKPRIDVVSVSSASANLGSLVPLQDWTAVVTIRPHADGIFMDDDTIADTGTADPLGISPIEIIGGRAELGGLHFRTASGSVKMTVMQEG